MGRQTFVLLFSACFVLAAPSWSKPEPSAPRAYSLHARHIGPEGAGSDIIRLFHRRTSQIVWSRIISQVDAIGWSADHRALALSVFGNFSTHTFRLLVWREGHKPFLYDGTNRKKEWGNYHENDGVIDFAWSPDKQRLLFRIWGSGGKDLDEGSICCLDVTRKKLYIVDGARRMQWVSNRRIIYRKMTIVEHENNVGMILDPEKYYWTCP